MKVDTTEQKLAQAEQKIKDLKQECIRLNYFVHLLEEALASPEEIEADTKATGGFVGGLNTSITDDEVVYEAVRRLKMLWPLEYKLVRAQLNADYWQKLYMDYSSLPTAPIVVHKDTLLCFTKETK